MTEKRKKGFGYRRQGMGGVKDGVRVVCVTMLVVEGGICSGSFGRSGDGGEQVSFFRMGDLTRFARGRLWGKGRSSCPRESGRDERFEQSRQ